MSATPLRGWAASLGVQRRLAAPGAPAIRGSYTALSGDSSATRTVERWDPVLGRWPMWSEALVHTLGPEIGSAYWTNLGLWRAELTMSPSARTRIRATYSHLSAFHPFPGSPDIFGNGTHRGDLLQARLDLGLSSRLKGHVLYERLFPGSFYSHRAPGYLLRLEGTLALHHRWR